jgi:hypothetical protein
MAALQQELAAGASFNTLAEKHSTSVMARGGGRIDWTARRQLQPAAADAVFALVKEGDVSPLVTTADGLHLFRLDGIRLASVVDAAALRTEVRQELDAEARNAALRSRRQQEVDTNAVEFAPASRLAPLETAAAKPGSNWVARWKTGTLSEAEIVALHGRILPTQQPIGVELRYAVENRLLAALRRSKQSTPELDAKVAAARRQVVIDSYRGDLMDALDTPATPEEVARFHRENAASASFLRDFEVDVLFFPQTEGRVAEVYAAGEDVVGQLRKGATFDDLLRRRVRPDVRTCLAVHGVDPEEVGRTSIRLRKALVNLAAGEVSAAIYVDQPVKLGSSGCALDGRGIAFLRLRGIGTLPLPAARLAILKALSKERVDKGVAAIQDRLIAASKLEILVPEG